MASQIRDRSEVRNQAGPRPASVRELDEVLVVDPRSGQTPAQMVDQKLLALLQAGHPGLVLQASGRPQDIRGIAGRQRALSPFSKTTGALQE